MADAQELIKQIEALTQRTQTPKSAVPAPPQGGAVAPAAPSGPSDLNLISQIQALEGTQARSKKDWKVAHAKFKRGEAIEEAKAVAADNKAPAAEAGIKEGIANTLDLTLQVMRQVEQGFTFGLGDEIEAVKSAVFQFIISGGQKSFGETYDRVHAEESRQRKKFTEEHPKTSLASEIAGSLAPALLTGGAAFGPAATRGVVTKGVGSALRRPNIAGRVAKGTGVTAAAGGAYGFNTGEGGVEGRLSGVAAPATVGAVLGAVSPVVGALARPVLAHLAKRGAAKQAGFTQPRSKLSPARLVPGNTTKVETRGIDPIQEALEHGARDVTGEANLHAIPEPLPESLWAGIYPATRGLVSESIAKLGRLSLGGRKIIEDRADEAVIRIPQALDDTLGLPEGVEEVVQRMRTASGPAREAAYGTAYATRIDYESAAGKRLTALITDQVPGSAITEANNLLRLRGHPLIKVKLHDGDEIDRIIELESPLTVRQTHYLLQSMGDLIKKESNKVAPGQSTTAGKGLADLSKEIKEELGTLAPAFRAASALAEPDYVAREAMELGQKSLKPSMTPDTFKAEIAALKGRHKNLGDLIDQNVNRGLRNGIQEGIDRAKVTLSPTPSQAGYVATGAGRDPAVTKAVKTLSDKVLRQKVEIATGRANAKHLFLELDNGEESILARDAVKDNVRKLADETLNRVTTDAGIVKSALNLQFGDAIQGIGKRVAKTFSRAPEVKPPTASQLLSERSKAERVEALKLKRRKAIEEAKAVTSALLQPADRAAMERVKGLRAPGERGLEGARRAETIFAGGGLASTLPNTGPEPFGAGIRGPR